MVALEEQGRPLAAILGRAQSGDREAHEELLRTYLPFILASVSDVVKRQVSVEDDEVSAAMSAFSEAIGAYQAGRGRFLPFARTVIRRRVYDYLRRQAKFSVEVPSNYLSNPFSTPLSAHAVDQTTETVQSITAISISSYEKELEAFELREEIASLNQELKDLGVTFSDVAYSSPRQQETKRLAIQAATCISRDSQFLDHIKIHRRLPLKEVARQILKDHGSSHLSNSRLRKTLERHRAYILAVALILAGDYGRLKAYARW